MKPQKKLESLRLEKDSSAAVYRWVGQLINDIKSIQESNEWKIIAGSVAQNTPVDFSNVLCALIHIQDGTKSVQKGEENKEIENEFQDSDTNEPMDLQKTCQPLEDVIFLLEAIQKDPDYPSVAERLVEKTPITLEFAVCRLKQIQRVTHENILADLRTITPER